VKLNNKSNVEEYLGIVVDYSRDSIIPEKGLTMLTKKGFYKKDHEESPQQSLARAATCYSFGDYDFAQRMYDYVSKGWYTNASPVLTNAMEIDWPTFDLDSFDAASDWLAENVTPDGMPISCFLVNNGSDTKEGLVESRKEANWLSMMGGGIGVYMGNRSPDEKSTGVMAHLKGYDADSLSYKQTSSRRGSIAAYMDITHPEILSFISMRNAADGGDPNKKCFNLNNAVNITDSFMEAVIRNEEYELIDPKHGNTGKLLKANGVFEKILEMRFETGEPYIAFIDTINRNIPKWLTKPTYNVKQSNLCSEITLMTSAKRTAVCCLSSLNLAKYDEWKDTTIVEDLVRYLDNVLEYFIRLAPPTLHRAVYSASKERAVGIGTLGWHSLLQSKGVPLESSEAASLNYHIFKGIKEKAVESSKQLASERGECSDCFGSGIRNSHLMAVAPNASSSEMVGASPSIEPWSSNCFNSQGRAGSFLVKNTALEELLKTKSKNLKEVWDSILTNDGSVQHLDYLSDNEKKVFKTFSEIDPQVLIEQAGVRQEFICQSQSLNIKVKKDITKQQMSDIHILAWAKGLKSLYYCRAEGAQKTSIAGSGQPLNQVQVEIDFNVCKSCEG